MEVHNMKRDIDLCRQLLLDIENHGTDCSLSVLRTSVAQDADEHIRYHLRLLIDAGFVKEIDRTSAGVPCVRLTSSGHEFIELVRGDARWREAKWIVQEQTGGQSLTVMRALLTKWAVENTARSGRHRLDDRDEHYRDERLRRYRRTYRSQYHLPHYYHPEHYRTEHYRTEPYRTEPYRTEPYRYEPHMVDSYRFEREPAIDEDEELRLLRGRPDYREQFDFYDRFSERDGYKAYERAAYEREYDREYADAPIGVTLPVSLL